MIKKTVLVIVLIVTLSAAAYFAWKKGLFSFLFTSDESKETESKPSVTDFYFALTGALSKLGNNPYNEKENAADSSTPAVPTQGTSGNTVAAHTEYSPEQDAIDLFLAMRGMGTDEETIYNIFTDRTNEQKKAIAARYRQKYNRDLLKQIESELTPAEFKMLIPYLE